MEDNHVSNPTVRRFIAGLRMLEQRSDPEPLLELFAEDVELTRLDGPPRHGPAEARAFWTEYREMFSEVRTTVFDAVESDRQAALEWRSKATLANGGPIAYLGVTVLDLDGEQVTGVRTYYDTAAFLEERALGSGRR